MATLTVHRPLRQRSLLDPPEEAVGTATASPPPASRPSRPTLDDLVAGAWDALAVTHAAACPVCGGALAPRYGSGPQPVAAACGGCGSHLG